MRLIKRRTNQIVHRRVDDDKILGVAMLHIDYACDENACVADDHATRLEQQRTAEIMRHPLDHIRIGQRRGRCLSVGVIRDAKTATKIDV